MNDDKRSRQKSRRVVIAFAAGPAIAAAVVTIIFLVLGLLLDSHDDALAIIVGGLFGGILILGYLSSTLVGIPIYLLFRRLGWRGRRHGFLLGAVIGALTGALFALVGLLNSGNAGSHARKVVFAGAVIGVLLAGLMGLIFAWLIRPKVSKIDEVAATFD